MPPPGKKRRLIQPEITNFYDLKHSLPKSVERKLHENLAEKLNTFIFSSAKNSNQNKSQESLEDKDVIIAALKTQIAERDKTIESKSETISLLTTQINKLKKKNTERKTVLYNANENLFENVTDFEIEDNDKNKLVAVPLGKTHDTAFIRVALTSLYRNNIELLRSRSLKGRNKKSEISPKKLNAVRKLFIQRLYFDSQSSSEFNERLICLNTLVSKALSYEARETKLNTSQQDHPNAADYQCGSQSQQHISTGFPQPTHHQYNSQPTPHQYNSQPTHHQYNSFEYQPQPVANYSNQSQVDAYYTPPNSLGSVVTYPNHIQYQSTPHLSQLQSFTNHSNQSQFQNNHWQYLPVYTQICQNPHI